MYTTGNITRNTIAMVLAGGKGERLSPITIGRPKPAVPFGGKYKIIDFVLSNLFNSGIRKTYILTQYQAYSLNRHIKDSWGKWTGLGESTTPSLRKPPTSANSGSPAPPTPSTRTCGSSSGRMPITWSSSAGTISTRWIFRRCWNTTA